MHSTRAHLVPADLDGFSPRELDRLNRHLNDLTKAERDG